MSAHRVDDRPERALRVVSEQLAEAVAASKCHACGCLHQTVAALEGTEIGATEPSAELSAARAAFVPRKYDCLGCPVCGDAVCEGAEDCTSCVSDCGVCTATDPTLPGPYAACYTGADISHPSYQQQRLHYPCSPGTEPSGAIAAGVFGASTLSPGWGDVASDIFWLGEHAATHGFVVHVMTPDSVYGDNPEWRDAHVAAYHELLDEAARSGSPIQGAIMTDRIQIMGYSKGGGGTLMAAQELTQLGWPLGAVQPLAPYYDSWSPVDLITAPVAIHVGASDTTARPSSHSIPMFDALDPDTTRLLAIYQGLDHEEWTDPGGSHIPAMKQYIIAWMKLHIDENAAYRTYLDGAEHVPSWFTTYELLEPASP